MQSQEPLTVTLEPDPLQCWAEESTASALRALAVRLHSSGLSLRETAAALEQFGGSRSHQAVFQWVHRVSEEAPDPPTATPSRVAVDETAATIGTTQHWQYAAIDVETKLLLDVMISPRRGTDPAAAFLGRLAEKHDLSEATFLVDGMGYLTALARCDLHGHLDDVNGALNAGMQGVWFNRKGRAWEPYGREPDLIIESFHELAESLTTENTEV